MNVSSPIVCLMKYVLLVFLGMESKEFKSSMPDREFYYAGKEIKVHGG